MCDVESNPKWTLHHIDELLDNLEKNADEDDLTRMLKHDYRLTLEEEQPDYVEKRNRVFVALVDFIHKGQMRLSRLSRSLNQSDCK